MTVRFNHRLHRTISTVLSVASLGLATPAFSEHGGSDGKGHAHVDAIGAPGNPAEATRTIEVIMADNYYEPEQLEVTPGETVKFVVRNEGALVHEFNIGTAGMHREQQAELRMMLEHGIIEFDKIHRDRMKMDMGGGHVMDHDEPNAILLEPGEAAEVTWKFHGRERLEFACNMPGHYESGMVGQIALKQ